MSKTQGFIEIPLSLSRLKTKLRAEEKAMAMKVTMEVGNDGVAVISISNPPLNIINAASML